MKQFIERHHKLLAIIGASIIIVIIGSGLIFGPFNQILPEALRVKLGYVDDENREESITVRLLVNFNGFSANINHSVTFPQNQSANAYSILLLANLTVTIENYQNGIYVKGINGVIQNGNHFWLYSVDGISGTVAADNFNLRANGAEVVIWQYQKV